MDCLRLSGCLLLDSSARTRLAERGRLHYAKFVRLRARSGGARMFVTLDCPSFCRDVSMPRCTHCQQAVDADAQRCPQCGAWLADAPQMAPDSLESSVRQLLAQGQKIAAIKLYREETGVGLAEAKEAG